MSNQIISLADKTSRHCTVFLSKIEKSNKSSRRRATKKRIVEGSGASRALLLSRAEKIGARAASDGAAPFTCSITSSCKDGRVKMKREGWQMNKMGFRYIHVQ